MPIPVKLSDVVNEMDILSDEVVTYLNRVTGEFVFVTEEMGRAAETEDEDEDEWDDLPAWERELMPEVKQALESEDYVALPGKFEIHEWSIMEEFARSVQDNAVSDELDSAIHGRGAFRYFKDTIHRLGIQNDWYRFRDEAFKQIARDWLVAHNIPFVE